MERASPIVCIDTSSDLYLHAIRIMKKIIWTILFVVGGMLAIGMFLPTKIQNPVEGCGKESYNPKSFWHPWGDHKHRGIDIFAKKGTPVHPAIGGIVVATAHNKGAGGNCILVLSSGLRLHYYAHLSEIDTHAGAIFPQFSHWKGWRYGQCEGQTCTSALQHRHHYSTRRLAMGPEILHHFHQSDQGDGIASLFLPQYQN